MEKEQIKEKIRLFEQEYTELLEKYGLKMAIDMEFPQYQILPPKVELAIRVLLDEGLQYRTSFKEKK